MAPEDRAGSELDELRGRWLDRLDENLASGDFSSEELSELGGFAEAFNRRDFEAAFAPIPPDLVFAPLVAERGQAEALAGELRELHGREELVGFFRDWVEEFPDWRVDVEGFASPTPGVIFVTSTVRGTGRSSGVPVTRRFTEVWDMRSQPIRVSQHQNEADALEAAGLSDG